MTTTIQLSDRKGEAILLVKVEVDDLNSLALGEAEATFAAAAGLVGLGAAYESFGNAPAATIPSITQLTRPPAPPQDDPWGTPPVPPMQPQPQQHQYQQPAPQYAPQQQYAPQVPAAAGGAPGCQHGTKEFISGISPKNGKEWKAWACPARREDPTKCEKEWIR